MKLNQEKSLLELEEIKTDAKICTTEFLNETKILKGKQHSRKK
jgi:hypothetical protein